ncbi:MAG: vWA domain-containing protein [Nannocystaceae bacterium]
MTNPIPGKGRFRHTSLRTFLLGAGVPTLCCAVLATASAACAPSGDDRDPPMPSDGGVPSDGDPGTTDNVGEVSSKSTEKFDIGKDSGNDDDTEVPSDIDDTLSKKIDLLFVIDNSGSMGEEQANLARNFPNLIQQLENLQEGGENAKVDVNILVTTTDMGHTACSGTTPEAGDPVTTGCNERIGSFDAWGNIPAAHAACTDVCEEDVNITGSRPFIHFKAGGNGNVEDVEPKDVNGDGVADSAVAQALACLGPQGIDGCGFEGHLEAMMQAIDPNAAHNTAEKPFLRDGAMLAIAFATDEADCSVNEGANPELFDREGDKAFWETNPENGKPGMTSAICWNAGTECDDNGDGTYECSSREGELRPLDRYRDYLNYLIDDKEKAVVMLGIVGIPLVTAHADAPPYQPTEGGVFDLKYRDWDDAEYPDGDILPDDWAADPRRGADHQKYSFGIGPGCTGKDEDGEFTGQAIPPRRIRDVCESLNREADGDDEPAKIRCCMESICDDDFSAAINCLAGLIIAEVIPQ